ncbi:hypothetical protein ABZ512_24745 [Nocardiopsis dassonvillei]|uniref:Immunity protein 35 domain-containing protein n=1 Tax=Nocardiopsis alborubida TaxID=146802 RepID=A0A7X6MCP9_9ACTN|nr:hypothetical protein [Nocardiopsis alborubida]NKY98847.1 hypothetical protein [Nocardiopsis alborubida]
MLTLLSTDEDMCSMMTKEEAIEVARKFFDDAVGKLILQGGMISERDIFCHEKYVVLPWDSIAFLKEGKWEECFIGNAPIRVDRETGGCEFIGVRQAVEYRKLGFPV